MRTHLGVGSVVLYVSHGSPVQPDGSQRYPSVPRAAIVTAVPATRTKDNDYGTTVSLCVLNPTGMFFDLAVPHSDDVNAGGTWHWPDHS